MTAPRMAYGHSGRDGALSMGRNSGRSLDMEFSSGIVGDGAHGLDAAQERVVDRFGGVGGFLADQEGDRRRVVGGERPDDQEALGGRIDGSAHRRGDLRAAIAQEADAFRSGAPGV